MAQRPRGDLVGYCAVRLPGTDVIVLLDTSNAAWHSTDKGATFTKISSERDERGGRKQLRRAR